MEKTRKKISKKTGRGEPQGSATQLRSQPWSKGESNIHINRKAKNPEGKGSLDNIS